MYTVSDKFKNYKVHCNKFSVLLSDATQEQLEHLFHLGVKGIEFVGKKPKNKQVDNAVSDDKSE